MRRLLLHPPPTRTGAFPPLCPETYPRRRSHPRPGRVFDFGYNFARHCALNDTATARGDARPDVTIKYAQTLDGRIATSTRDSRWISGPQARVLAHRLRAEHDAVMVGIGTVIADDPELTVRLCTGPDPVKIIVDSALRTPVTAAVLTSGTAPIVIATTSAASEERRRTLEDAGVQILQSSSLDQRVDLRDMLEQLLALGIKSLLVEGGAGIITSLLRSRLADRMVIVTAPKLIGTGLAAIGDLGIERVSAALSFIDPTFETHGQDLVFSGTIAWPPE